MPRRPQSDVEPQLRRRTELAIKLAHEWLSVMNASQRGLARRLGADQSVLSRFLSQQPGYEPARNRPRILKLLEDIEQVCTQLEDVTPIVDWEDFDSTDDVQRWEHTLAVRLRQLRQALDPGQALTKFPELSVQALHFPGLGRAFTCINACLAGSVQIAAEWRQRVCSPRLIQETVMRLTELETAALEVLSSSSLEAGLKSRHESRCHSYVGAGLAFGGLRLNDASLISSGVAKQLQAVQVPGELKDRTWHNLLATLDVLLSEKYPEAEQAALQAANIGRETPRDCLALALADREIPSLKSFWSGVAPDLLEG